MKPGDYCLRASNTQPGWIAIEYLPPSLVRGFVDGSWGFVGVLVELKHGGVALSIHLHTLTRTHTHPYLTLNSHTTHNHPYKQITAHDPSSLLPESGPQLHTQPHTSLFYFHLEQPSTSTPATTTTDTPPPPKLLFTSQQGTHTSLAALILQKTGADSWGQLHQRAALRLPLPPPKPTPVETPTTAGVKRQAGGQEVLADGAGMVLNSPGTRRRKEKAHQPKAAAAAAMKGGVESLMPITPTPIAVASSGNARAGGQQQQQAVSAPSHRRGVGNGGNGSLDSFGLPPGLSSLDFAHSFGGGNSVGPSLSFHLEHPTLSQLYQPHPAPQQQAQQPKQLQEEQELPAVAAAMAVKADGGMGMGGMMGVTGAGGGGSHHALVPSLDDSFPLQVKDCAMDLVWLVGCIPLLCIHTRVYHLSCL